MNSPPPAKYFCLDCDLSFADTWKLQRHQSSDRHKTLASCRLRACSSADGQAVHAHCPVDSNYMYDSDSDSAGEADQYALCSALECIGIDSSGDEHEDDQVDDEDFGCTDLLELLKTSTSGQDYRPFKSKSAVLLYLLVHSPYPVGYRNLKFVQGVMKSLDASTPSISSVKSVDIPGFVPPVKFYSKSGTPFYVNLPSTILKKCLGNPLIAGNLHRYPVETAECLEQMFEGKRWHDDRVMHTPMVHHNGERLFIGEFITFDNDDNCHGKILKIFQNRPGCIFLDVVMIYGHVDNLEVRDRYYVKLQDAQPDREFVHHLRRECILKTSDKGLEPLTDEEWRELFTVHRLRDESEDRTVLVLPILLYCDDTSGNRSKKWNGFNLWCMLLAALSKEENGRLKNIHLLTCSNLVPPLQMARPIVDDLSLLEEQGLVVYDAFLKEEILLVTPVLTLLADNPRASELVNHMGSTARKYCRICHADKVNNPHETEPRRTKADSIATIEKIRATPAGKKKSDLATYSGLKEDENPLFELSVDLYRSTPIECLHTILLGPYKYLTAALMYRLKPSQKQELAARIRDFPTSGIKPKLSTNIIRHHKSFHGKDFKIWAQMCLYIAWEYMTTAERAAWLALSEVFILAYCTHYNPDNHDEYQRICTDFFTSVKNYDETMLAKLKIHLLLHLPESMREFGATSSYNTERCEAFNGIVRHQNLSTNHHAASKDITKSFAMIEQLRFLADGGKADKVGDDFRKVLSTEPVQSLLFQEDDPSRKVKRIYQHGTLRKKKDLAVLNEIKIKLHGTETETTLATITRNGYLYVMGTTTLSHRQTVTHYSAVMCNGQLINNNECMAFKHHEETEVGVLLAGAATADGEYCIMQMFEMDTDDASSDPIVNEYNCRTLTLLNMIIVVETQNLVAPASIVHQCDHTCTFNTLPTHRKCEREDIELTQLNLVHNFGNKKYILNKYCMSSY